MRLRQRQIVMMTTMTPRQQQQHQKRKNSSKNIILPSTVLVLAGRGKGKVRSQLMLMLTILYSYHSVCSASYQDRSAMCIHLLICNQEWDRAGQSSCPLQCWSERDHDLDRLLWYDQDGLDLVVSVLA